MFFFRRRMRFPTITSFRMSLRKWLLGHQLWPDPMFRMCGGVVFAQMARWKKKSHPLPRTFLKPFEKCSKCDSQHAVTIRNSFSMASFPHLREEHVRPPPRPRPLPRTRSYSPSSTTVNPAVHAQTAVSALLIPLRDTQCGIATEC